MSARSVVFLESNTTGTGRQFARAASELGFRPVLLTDKPSRYPQLVAEMAEVVRVPTSDPQAIDSACRRLAGSGGLAAVTSSSEYFVALAAATARRFGLPAATPRALEACRDKELQRETLLAAGVPVPVFVGSSTVGGAVEASRDTGLPAVVKPTQGSGSVGVALCRTEREVADWAAQLLERQTNERGLPMPCRVLVEQFVRGLEFSVEAFNGRVVGVTSKHLGAPPRFVEIGHDFPARLSRASLASVTAVAESSLACLGVVHGPGHVELRLTRGRPVVIEVNPRLAGGRIPDLVHLAWGVDLVRASVEYAAGLPPTLAKRSDCSSSIRFLLASSDGRVAWVRGVALARAVPGVVEVDVQVETAQEIDVHGDFRDRIGHVIACGSRETKTAAEAADEALSCICVRLER